MEEKKEITIQDVKKLLLGLDPITRKNLLAFTEKKSAKEIYTFILHFKKKNGLDSEKGMKKYIKARVSGCKNCSNKK